MADAVNRCFCMLLFVNSCLTSSLATFMESRYLHFWATFAVWWYYWHLCAASILCGWRSAVNIPSSSLSSLFLITPKKVGYQLIGWISHQIIRKPIFYCIFGMILKQTYIKVRSLFNLVLGEWTEDTCNRKYYQFKFYNGNCSYVHSICYSSKFFPFHPNNFSHCDQKVFPFWPKGSRIVAAQSAKAALKFS